MAARALAVSLLILVFTIAAVAAASADACDDDEGSFFACLKSLVFAEIRKSGQKQPNADGSAHPLEEGTKINATAVGQYLDVELGERVAELVSEVKNFTASFATLFDDDGDDEDDNGGGSNDGAEPEKKKAEVTARKLKMKASSIIPFLLVPALVLTGLLPFILPALKFGIVMSTMINNMAFNVALFALIRSYIFDKSEKDHVVYVNYGYRKKNRKKPKYEPYRKENTPNTYSELLEPSHYEQPSR